MLESLKNEVQAAIDQAYAENMGAKGLKAFRRTLAAGKRVIKCFRDVADLHIKAQKLACESALLRKQYKDSRFDYHHGQSDEERRAALLDAERAQVKRERVRTLYKKIKRGREEIAVGIFIRTKNRRRVKIASYKIGVKVDAKAAAAAVCAAKLTFAESAKALFPPVRANYWINRLNDLLKTADAEAKSINTETRQKVWSDVVRKKMVKVVVKGIRMSGVDAAKYSSFVAEASARYSVRDNWHLGASMIPSNKADDLMDSFSRHNMIDSEDTYQWAGGLIYSDDRFHYRRIKSIARPADTSSYGKARAEQLLRKAFSA